MKRSSKTKTPRGNAIELWVDDAVCPTCASPLAVTDDPIADRYEVGCTQCLNSTRAQTVAAALDGYLARTTTPPRGQEA